MNINNFPTFREIFESLDDETLIHMYLSDPSSLRRMCMLYSLDLQIEKEENEDSSNRRDVC